MCDDDVVEEEDEDESEEEDVGIEELREGMPEGLTGLGCLTAGA